MQTQQQHTKQAQQDQQQQPFHTLDNVFSAQSPNASSQAHTAQKAQLAPEQQYELSDNAIEDSFMQQTSAGQRMLEHGTEAAQARRSAAQQMGSKAVICKALSPTRPAVPSLGLTAMHDSTKTAGSATGSQRWVGIFQKVNRLAASAELGFVRSPSAGAAVRHSCPCCDIQPTSSVGQAFRRQQAIFKLPVA